MIIEDEANIRKFVMVNLLARGHEVMEAENAADGLAKLYWASPKLMLLDIKLPDMSGWDLLTLILNDPHLPKPPVIVLTASLGESRPAEIQYPDLYRVLVKPVAAMELVKVVEEALSREGSR
jgi:DNA-binding response OmpR family regulator